MVDTRLDHPIVPSDEESAEYLTHALDPTLDAVPYPFDTDNRR
ncbi:MAG: hypothetical protein J07HX64_00991 [halophilic archaeon J07HX64]|nr:MAG: hypothetical protein J07HX64_00991 [halophilic archaeon J07HX64]